MMNERRGVRAVFMRGGTSKALVFQARDLPAGRAERDAFFLSAMGSPDPGRRQLDGMGGGVSSLSKVCIVAPSARDDADVDFTFVQIPIDGNDVDMSGNCGNMSSAVGPFAVEEGIVSVSDGEASVRIFNTNTGKIIVSRFPVRGGMPVERGNTAIPGVAGTGAPIRLEFVDPGGATSGRLLPTGSAVDRLEDEGEAICVSVVDATACCVFVPASALRLRGVETPGEMEAHAPLMARLERLRRLAAVRAGLAPDADAAAKEAFNPKVAIIGPPQDYRRSDGGIVTAAEHDVAVRMLSMGQPHRAIPLTGALCTAVAARISGTLVADGAVGEVVRIGHASGVLPASAEVRVDPDGTVDVVQAGVWRTARRLMEGVVYG
jgi:hypothetical protein